MNCVETDGQPHTGEYLAKVAGEGIDTAKAEFGCEVVGCVTDSASNMVSMREQLALKRPGMLISISMIAYANCFPLGIFTYNCQCHIVNLLCNDILKERGRDLIMKNVILVLKTFRTTHSLCAGLRRLGVGRPTLPAPTRWASHRQSLAFYNTNWAYLAQVCFPFVKHFF
jgi:hypothetical protein